MTKVLIDTTVLVYAFDNSDGEKHEKAGKILTELEASGNGILSIQNIVEFARVLTEKSRLPQNPNMVRSYILQLKKLFEVKYYNENTVAEALHLSSVYGIHFFDALIAATMEENFIYEIATENENDFRKITNLKITNPFK